MSSNFNRGLNQSFIDKLNEEYANGGWWTRIASERDFFIAIREDYLNVYWRGCSLLRLDRNKGSGDLIGKIHYKYLLKNDATGPYVTLNCRTGKLDHKESRLYDEFPDARALRDAAKRYAGEEKTGVHQIVLQHRNVIDVEIAFSVSGNEGASSTPRIDFATLRPTTDVAEAEVVFYEAKDFRNKELRSSSNTPKVVEQIENYQKVLRNQGDDLVSSYRRVCGNLVALEGAKKRYEKPELALMHGVSTGEVPLRINGEVRLVIFGFDAAQRNDAGWRGHLEKLQNLLGEKRVLTKGDPKGFTHLT